MVFNLELIGKSDLTVENINSKSGSWLHSFSWVKGDDEASIGGIDERWNFVPDHSERNLKSNQKIGAIHYTEGHPCLDGFETCKYSDTYYREVREFILGEKINNGT